MPRRTLFALAATALAALMAWPAPCAASGRLNVVATTGMIADAARAIAGDRAQVTQLMGEGVDPHTYRQTRNDVVRLGQADLVLHNGLYLEAQLDDLLRELGRRKPVVAVGEGISPDRLLTSADYEGMWDPHIWMDVRLWREAAAVIRDALADLDADGRDVYEANADAYSADLDRLDAYAREALASVPEAARALVSAHDAFGYFGRAYDFEVIGIQGISTDSEAGLRRIEELVAMIVERGISAVFVESSVSGRNVRALIEGAHARGHHLRLGGELFSDAMGAPGTYEGTYVGMIDHNVTLVTRALGGEAPALGLNGRLRSGS